MQVAESQNHFRVSSTTLSPATPSIQAWRSKSQFLKIGIFSLVAGLLLGSLITFMIQEENALTFQNNNTDNSDFLIKKGHDNNNNNTEINDDINENKKDLINIYDKLQGIED